MSLYICLYYAALCTTFIICCTHVLPYVVHIHYNYYTFITQSHALYIGCIYKVTCMIASTICAELNKNDVCISFIVMQVNGK